ncbi:hypothetical protein [Staphylococcus hominis]|uniref:hypothetical protein n=1 Tax=Staphylococcus hominis TaxID=1290 RepID=UPI00287A01EF|nr:hypothetical protein [Staphylococcus hominis]MDS3852923.1 hypothetical protein [Staphylococcus hominis]
MLTLTKHIEKRIILPYLLVFIVEIIFKAFFAIWEDDKLDMIHGIWIMISTSLLIVYSLYDMYTLIYSRKHYFYYTLKYNINTILFIHSLLYIINNFVFYLLYVNYDNVDILAKLISLISFYALNLALLLIFRSMSNIKIGSLLYLLILAIITLTYSISFVSINLNNHTIKQFMVGAVNNDSIFQIYTILIPITVISGKEHALITNTLLINIVIAIISLVLYFFLRKRKYNW